MDSQKTNNPEYLDMLLNCENASPYGDPLLHITSENREVVIISDLHLGPGLSKSAEYPGTENFFADESLGRFLKYMDLKIHMKGAPGALLIINGDFIDFLRVTAYPDSEHDFSRWTQILDNIGIGKNMNELRNSIGSREKKFGLKTDDFKSVWKFDLVINGHAEVFEALAGWISSGNKIVITKGNHDLEFYWPAVRNFLRLRLAEILSDINPAASLYDCLSVILDSLAFADNACLIDEEIYAVHGHNYDKLTTVAGGPVLKKNRSELNIPFGSFFNRYLLNKIELIYPFYDNIRPSQNIIHVMMRERFFTGLKILFYYFPFTIKMIRKRYLKFIFKPVAGYVLAVGLPVLLVLALWGNQIFGFFDQTIGNQGQPSGMLGFIGSKFVKFLTNGVFLFLSYLFSRLISFLQLKEPDYLMAPGKNILQENRSYKFVTMGHTHNPEQFCDNGRWYINSSTWIPIIESSSGALREDKTYTVIYLERDPAEKLIINPLQRWNDEAGRLEPLILISRK